MVQAVTDATFEKEVLKSDKPVVVDFWASWCGPCRALAPALEQLAEEKASQIKVVKLDVDASPETTAEYKIRAIPTLLLFRDGQVVDSAVGYRSKAQLAQWIDAHLAPESDKKAEAAKPRAVKPPRPGL